jgi:hypothetical protein
LLHYFSPELTFADPDNKDFEIVTRLHHRSGIFGLFGGVAGGRPFFRSDFASISRALSGLTPSGRMLCLFGFTQFPSRRMNPFG